MTESTGSVAFSSESVDLFRYVDILIRRRRVILVCLLLSILTGVLAVLLTQRCIFIQGRYAGVRGRWDVQGEAGARTCKEGGVCREEWMLRGAMRYAG